MRAGSAGCGRAALCLWGALLLAHTQRSLQLSDLHDQAKLPEIQPITCLYACESLSSGEVPFLDGDGTAGMNHNMQGMFMLCQSARKFEHRRVRPGNHLQGPGELLGWHAQ